MVRLAGGAYQYGMRSFDLLKVKSFLDAEFPIVGHKTGVGKSQGAVIWLCRTPNGPRRSRSSPGARWRKGEPGTKKPPTTSGSCLTSAASRPARMPTTLPRWRRHPRARGRELIPTQSARERREGRPPLRLEPALEGLAT
jgi:hypothetical protein